MPRFGKSSMSKLRTVHPDLQTLFQVVVKYFDCTVVYGNRTTEEQQALYAQGRTKPGGIVTNCDGVKNKSKHQGGNAVDAVPYPIDWSDTNRMKYFAGFVIGIARILKDQGIIDSEIRSGYDWDGDTEVKDTNFIDLPHFQIQN